MPTTDEQKATAAERKTARATAKAGAAVEVGDTVHYVWPDSGHHHAAFVANVLDADRGYVTLSVLDHNGGYMQSPWVAYDPGGAPGTWHEKDHGDDAEKLDPAGLNIAEDGTTPVPQGLTAAVPGARSDEERAAEARVPDVVLKDDPMGHRIADNAARAGAADRVDRTAITETAGEKVARAARDGTRAPSDPAARNVAREPSAVHRAEQATTTTSAAEHTTVRGRTEGTRTEGNRTTSSRSADVEANSTTERNSAQTDPKTD